MPRQGKKSADGRMVKNPGFCRNNPGQDESLDDDAPPVAGQCMEENDELDQLDLGMEQGEILSDVGNDHEVQQNPDQLAQMVRVVGEYRATIPGGLRVEKRSKTPK